VTLSGKRAKDRRVQKTQRLLHEALASLIHEKDYDAILVKEILNRANIGRSTFYTHFRDKDDLLASGMHDMLASVQSTKPSSARRYEEMLRFSLPIFEHIDELRRQGQTKIGTRGRGILHEHLQKVLVELIANDAAEALQRPRKTAADRIPPELLIQYIVSTFILVLNWWVERSPLSAREANNVYRAMVLPTLAASSE
jgi:AcrR family transcriptional regulator